MLKTIYFNPTKYCNLKCNHCWIAPPFTNKKLIEKDALTLDEIKSLYLQGKEMGVISTKLTGGEPFVRKDIDQILKIINKLGIHLQIETNGTLIDKHIAKILADINKTDKKLFISTSIDGNSSQHDKRRGVQGAFNDTIQGIVELLKKDIHVQVIYSVGKDNIDSFDDILNLCKEFRVRSLKINFISEIERGKKMKKENNLLPIEEILSLNNSIENQSFKQYPFSILTNLPPAFRKIKKIRETGRCGIFSILGVLANGDISICGIANSLPELVCGNIKNSRLKDIWEKGTVFATIRKDIPSKLEGICSRCILKSFCLGQCRADSYYKYKDFKKSFDFCEEAFTKEMFPKRWLIGD